MNRVSGTGTGHHGAPSSGYSYNIERHESVSGSKQFVSGFISNGRCVNCPDMVLPSVIPDVKLRERILGLAPSNSKQRYYLKDVRLQWDPAALQTLINNRIREITTPSHAGRVVASSSHAEGRTDARPLISRSTEGPQHRSPTKTTAPSKSGHPSGSKPTPVTSAVDTRAPNILDAAFIPNHSRQITGDGPNKDEYSYGVQLTSIDGVDYMLFWGFYNALNIAALKIRYDILWRVFDNNDYKAILDAITYKDPDIKVPSAYLSHPIQLSPATAEQLLRGHLPKSVTITGNTHSPQYILTPSLWWRPPVAEAKARGRGIPTTTTLDVRRAQNNAAAWREMSRQSHIDFMNAGNPRTRYYSSGDAMF